MDCQICETEIPDPLWEMHQDEHRALANEGLGEAVASLYPIRLALWLLFVFAGVVAGAAFRIILA